LRKKCPPKLISLGWIMSFYMSRKNKPESHQQHEKSESSHKGLSIIIILCFLGIMPVLIWVSLPGTSTYTSVTTASPMVQTAAASAGLQICSSDNYPVTIPGGQSAVLYKLSPECNSPTSSTTVQILVVGFTSTDAMNAAMYQAQVTYQNWRTSNTAAFMSGYTVIVVQGAPGNQDVEEIAASLIEQGAVRII
jgi:hypothetical protein